MHQSHAGCERWIGNLNLCLSIAKYEYLERLSNRQGKWTLERAEAGIFDSD